MKYERNEFFSAKPQESWAEAPPAENCKLRSKAQHTAAANKK